MEAGSAGDFPDGWLPGRWPPEHVGTKPWLPLARWGRWCPFGSLVPFVFSVTLPGVWPSLWEWSKEMETAKKIWGACCLTCLSICLPSLPRVWCRCRVKYPNSLWNTNTVCSNPFPLSWEARVYVAVWWGWVLGDFHLVILPYLKYGLIFWPMPVVMR